MMPQQQPNAAMAINATQDPSMQQALTAFLSTAQGQNQAIIPTKSTQGQTTTIKKGKPQNWASVWSSFKDAGNLLSPVTSSGHFDNLKDKGHEAQNSLGFGGLQRSFGGTKTLTAPAGAPMPQNSAPQLYWGNLLNSQFQNGSMM